LIAYAIKAALASKMVDRVIVSTDIPQIAEAAVDNGAEVPFIRPGDLAKDDTPMAPVVLHALGRMEEAGYEPDIVVLLQPTSPLTKSQDIDDAIGLFLVRGGDSVISVVESDQPPQMHFSIDDGGFLKNFASEEFIPKRRQELRQTFIPNGAIYITSRTAFLKEKTFYTQNTVPFKMPKSRSVDINDEFHMQIAEFFLSR